METCKKVCILWLLFSQISVCPLLSWSLVGESGIENQIKQDLLGRYIQKNGVTWKFDSLSEFQSFQILNKYEINDIKEYEVKMELKGYDQGEIFLAILLMTYRSEKIRKILVKDLRQLR
ncbi:MAG: hypothetical protein H7A23_16060 [Leptospiraceae bacterium]|nr:hypothetical protein [Leptospiraceae bacterium]MCP5496062.1 hypothetical protein [Leptospiraceae bacterium]